MPQHKYDAFISYRHKEQDMAIAKSLHRQIETYHIPGYIKRQSGKKRMGKVFRDQDELPLLADLGEGIMKALDASEWLIVICSPDLPKSKWCMAEIDHFISLGRRDHILTVLISGEPKESFPPQLRFVASENGEVVEREPLAADVRGDNLPDMLKKAKKEKLRLLAPMLGVDYDDLKRRQRERFLKSVAAASAAVAALAVVAGTYVLNQNAILDKQIMLTEEQRQIAVQNEEWAVQERNDALISQSKFLSGLSGEAIASGDISTARLLALEALPKDIENPERPLIDEAVTALSNTTVSRRSGGYTLVSSLNLGKYSNFQYFEEDNLLRVGSTLYDAASGESLASIEGATAYNPIRSLVANQRSSGIMILDIKGKEEKTLTIPYETTPKDSYYGYSHITHLALPGDGRYLVAGKASFVNMERNYIKLIDVDTGECVKTLTDDDIFPDNVNNTFTEKGINSIAISDNAKYIAYSVFRNDGSQDDITLIDFESFSKVKGFTSVPVIRNNQTDEYSEMESILISPDGSLLCATDVRYGFQVFSIETGEFLYRKEPENSDFENYAVFSNDSKYLAVHSSAQTLVLNAATGEVITESSPDLSPVDWISFTDDNTMVYIRDNTRTIGFLDIGSNTAYSINNMNLADTRMIGSGYGAFFGAVKLGKNGFACVSNDGVYQIWKRTGDDSDGGVKTFTTATVETYCVAKAYSNDGSRFAVSNVGNVEIFPADLSKPPITVSIPPAFSEDRVLYKLFWSPDDKYILGNDTGSYVILIETATGKILHEWNSKQSRTQYQTFLYPSPDWSCFLLTNHYSSGGLYSLGTFELLWEPHNMSLMFYDAAAFSADGKTIYYDVHEPSPENGAISLGASIHAIDAKTGKSVKSLPYLMLGGYPASPDGKRMIVKDSEIGADGESYDCIMLDLESMEELWRRDDIQLDSVSWSNNSISWSENGKYFALSVDDLSLGGVSIYDAETGEMLYDLPSRGFPSFSPDNRYLCVRKQAADAGTFARIGYTGEVYDLQTGKLYVTLPQHGIFSPDGTKILMQDCLWEMKPLGQLVADTRNMLKGRELTPEERVKYFID